ncbi:hypothetical protein [Balneatrix alpica]|uniref:Uncharacterized protein n=1 Tax=Balneatrix alpica TaxID=75684 RepID=A0ABV5Z713_9GAMM|nr:hypothetical protein [Balneatrix alpica]
MEFRLNPADKPQLQQQLRLGLSYQERLQDAEAALRQAQAGRWWIPGVVCLLLFAMSSDLFLGAGFAFLLVHLYGLIKAKLEVGRLQERKQEVDFWLHRKGLLLLGQSLYFERDEKRTTPLDPYNDEHYGETSQTQAA